jgi:RNA polymerase sigma-70 factor (ECF subfamily)
LGPIRLCISPVFDAKDAQLTAVVTAAWPSDPIVMIADASLDLSDLLALAEGDRSALGRLYDRHAPLLLALGEKILRSRREAEDLLHDVFVEAWKHAGDYDPERGSVTTWLRLRMRSRAIDRVRSARLARATPLEEARGHTGDDHPSDPEAAANGHRLRDALSSLPNEQATVLMLGYFEGLSSSEIADRCGIPLGTVKSRVAAAMNKLRAHMGVAQGGA